MMMSNITGLVWAYSELKCVQILGHKSLAQTNITSCPQIVYILCPTHLVSFNQIPPVFTLVHYHEIVLSVPRHEFIHFIFVHLYRNSVHDLSTCWAKHTNVRVDYTVTMHEHLSAICNGHCCFKLGKSRVRVSASISLTLIVFRHCWKPPLPCVH